MEATTTQTPLKAFYTLDEAAEMISCTRQFLEGRIADGEIAVFRPSARMVRISKGELSRWIESFTHTATKALS